jgi:peptide/nickel transport system substrate-binding protein
VVDPELSLAEEPVWSDGNTTVSVPLKDWEWSDGSPVDVSNVAFWMGLLEAGKENFAGYSPGTFPDNLESTEFDEASNTVVFHLKSAVLGAECRYEELCDEPALAGRQRAMEARVL